MKRIDHCAQLDTADDQHIYVAARFGGSSGERSVDECRLDLLRHGREGARDDIRRGRSLAQHSCNFFENRTGAVGAEQRLIAAFVALQQPRVDEAMQLANHRARRQSGAAGDLTSVQRLVRSEQKQAEYAPAVDGKKNGCQGLLHSWQRLSPFLQQPDNALWPAAQHCFSAAFDLQHIAHRRHDVVGVVHGHHDLRSTACEPLDLVEHVRAHIAIQTCARFIQQQ
jgi:hypothetical protein